MSTKWRVAVIGCGYFANAQYFPNIGSEANAECVAAVDIVPERAEAACEKYGIKTHTAVYTSCWKSVISTSPLMQLRYRRITRSIWQS